MLKFYLRERKPDKPSLFQTSLLYLEVPSVKDIGYLPSSHDRFMSPHLVIFSKRVLEDILIKLGYKS